MKITMLLLFSLVCASSFAEEAVTPETTDKGTKKPTTVTTKPITVTANKVEEKLKNVPQSVTLVTSEEIQEKNIRNVGDLIREIPNLSSAFTYSEDVNFRGINTSLFTNTNPVTIYVDGVPHSNHFAYDALLDNVERVEVLRGPQGALYGKDAIGGVINIVSKKPKTTWNGLLGAELANQGGRLASFGLNGPIVKDHLYLNLNGKLANEEGWIVNNHPGMVKEADRKGEQRFNLGLLYEPTSATKLRLNASHDYQDNFWTKGGFIPSGKDLSTYRRDEASKANFDVETLTKTLSDTQSLDIEHKFQVVTLNAVTAHKSLQVDGDYDSDWGNNPLFRNLSQFQHSTFDTLSQEVRLSGGETGHWRWLSGLYLERDLYQNTRYGMQYPGAYVNPNPFGGKDVDFDDRSTTTTQTSAAFGQLMVPLATGLEATLGGRYQNVDKSMDSKFYMQPVGTWGAPPAIALQADHSWQAFLPKLALSYDLTPRWKTYASLAEGYLPGGYNFWTESNIESKNRFGPQTSTNYEIGLRSEQGRLYLSAALFYMDIKDVHVFSFDAASAKMLVSNAGKAHSQGAEVEANYAINEEWDVGGALGLTDALYDDYIHYDRAKMKNFDYKGKKIEKTPAYTARLGTKYTSSAGIYGRVDLRGQGERYFDAGNSLQDGAYTTLDLNIGYKRGPWDFYTYGRNIADTQYLATVAQQASGYIVMFGESQRFGLGLRYLF